MPAKKKDATPKADVMKGPKPKFVMIGKSKFVHVYRTEAWDRKHSQCQMVRKAMVAGKIDYKAKGISPEAASALDGCEVCATPLVIKAMESPEDRKAKAKDARDEVIERASGKPKKKGKNVVSSRKDVAKREVAKKSKKASMTKSGPRSTASKADGDPTLVKAQLLADFAKEHGWKASIEEDTDTGHTVVIAVNGNQEIFAWYIDGKYDVARHAEIRVGSWTGKLRGAHACRRQIAGEGRDKPHPEPGKGRSGPRKSNTEDDVPDDESPEDAHRRVPFLLDEDEAAIIDAVEGKTIRWRNGVNNTVQSARIPAKSKRTAITEHPKTGRRMLDFIEVVEDDHGVEVLGGERTVYLDKIIRVVG